MALDDLDRLLLDVMQREFPIEPRPFLSLASQTGETEGGVLERVGRMEKDGLIRELGPVFDLKRLGYTSTLCAAEVTPESVGRVAELINAFPEVTHNYLRNHALNIWFTVIARTEERIEAILYRVRAEEGVVRVLSLPATRIFKINAHFAVYEQPAELPRHAATYRDAQPHEFQDWEIRLIRQLSGPMPLAAQPFARIAEQAGIGEAEALERIRAWKTDGTIRRFGARVAHRAVGYPANGMSVWKAAPEQVESAGRFMAGLPEVSHCYLRPLKPEWDYNLYAMIHGPTEAAVLDVARRIADNTGLKQYEVLFSTKEFKKIAPRYFTEDATVS